MYTHTHLFVSAELLLINEARWRQPYGNELESYLAKNIKRDLLSLYIFKKAVHKKKDEKRELFRVKMHFSDVGQHTENTDVEEFSLSFRKHKGMPTIFTSFSYRAPRSPYLHNQLSHSFHI